VGLGTIVADILLHDAGRMGGLGFGHLFHLGGLCVDDLLQAFDLLVDELLVADLDQGSEKGGCHSDQGQGPEWEILNQPVGDDRGRKGLDHESVNCRPIRVQV
jgi:hypothetical protein